MKNKTDIKTSIYTLFVIISWVIFAFEDMTQIAQYIKAMFGINQAGMFNAETLYLLSNYILLLIICVLLSMEWQKQGLQHFLLQGLNGYAPVSLCCCLLLYLLLASAF